jgi:PAS domain S-box-containing protein
MSKNNSESYFQIAANIAPVLIWIANEEKSYIWFNKIWLDFRGRTLEQEIGNGWTEGIHSDDVDKCWEIYNSHFDAQKPFSMEYRLKNSSGEYCWFLDNGVPIFNDNGEFEGYVGSCTDISKHKKNELTTQQALDKLSKIANQVPGVVYQYRLRPDGSSHFPFASERIREIYRVSSEEVKNDAACVFTVLHPNDYTDVVESIHNSAKSLTRWNYQYRVRFEDGEVRWLHGNAEPELEGDGSVLWHGFITDVTERKNIELSLAKSEKRLNEILNLMPLPLFIKDCQHRVLLLNATCEAQWGNSAAQLLNTTGSHIYPPEQLAVFMEIDKQVFAEGKTIELDEWVWNDKLQENRLFHTYKKPVFDDNGKPDYLIGISVDITDAKKNEHALAESEFRWKFAVEGSGDGLWDWNVETGCVYFSKQWKNMLGFKEHEIGNSLEEWEKRIHPDDKAKTMKTVEAYLAGKTHLYINEHRVQCKDGSYKWILDRGIVVDQTKEGKPLRLIGTHSDISHQKQTEVILQQLVQQERALRLEQSQFMAMLAHELKTPLSVIQLALSSLSEKTGIVSYANKSVCDITNIINRCLLSEKIADEKIEIVLYKNNLLDTLERLCAEVRDSYRFRIDAEFSPTLTTDWQLINTILVNLMDNALKYSPAESSIEINISRENEGVLLTIQNLIGNAGFPDETEVFQKYYRNKAAHHETGSGLGLYLVKNMANLLGGSVNYYHDKNCVYFKLWLPFLASQPASQPASHNQ